MAAAGERFVRLSLAIGQHEDGYVDAYYGPPEWKTQAESTALTTAEIKARAAGLRDTIPATARAQALVPG